MNDGARTHVAVADQERACELTGTESPFRIEVRFVGGLSPEQQAVFATAADRWAAAVVGDLPSVRVGDDVVDDVLIEAEGLHLDGPGQVLGRAGPTRLRPASADQAALLPVTGVMAFDTADLAQLESDGALVDVIVHEMGHVLGIGSIWDLKGLLAGADTADPTFTGAAATAQYRALLADLAGDFDAAEVTAVPVENTGGPGTRASHWREAVFGPELMTGFLNAGENPLSRMTVASLADLGYEVDLAAADEYELPATPPPALVRFGRRLRRPVPVVVPERSMLT